MYRENLRFDPFFGFLRQICATIQEHIGIVPAQINRELFRNSRESWKGFREGLLPTRQSTHTDRVIGRDSLWPELLRAVHVVQPETVISWRRLGFKALWRWKSRPRRRTPKGPERDA